MTEILNAQIIKGLHALQIKDCKFIPNKSLWGECTEGSCLGCCANACTGDCIGACDGTSTGAF